MHELAIWFWKGTLWGAAVSGFMFSALTTLVFLGLVANIFGLNKNKK